MAKYIGKDFSRVDGVAKVTGTAKYAAEFHVPNLAHGYLVLSKIARGSISSIDTLAAKASPGVVRIFTHENTPKAQNAEEDPQFKALQSPAIVFNAQPVALVIAETFEQAREAALQVVVTYRKETPRTNVPEMMSLAKLAKTDPIAGPPMKAQGEPDKAMEGAAVRFEADYIIPHRTPQPHRAACRRGLLARR